MEKGKERDHLSPKVFEQQKKVLNLFPSKEKKKEVLNFIINLNKKKLLKILPSHQ